MSSRQARFLELESAQLVVSANPRSSRRAATKSIPPPGRTAPLNLHGAYVIDPKPAFPTALDGSISAETNTSQRGQRLCKVGVAWQNTRAQKGLRSGEMHDTAYPIYQAKLRSPAISILSS